MPTFAPLPSIAPPAAELEDAAAEDGLRRRRLEELVEPPDLLDEHALSASTAATPATTRPNTLLRIGGTAFHRSLMALGDGFDGI